MINPFRKSYSPKEISFFRFLTRIKLFEKLTYGEMAHFLPYLFLRTYKSEEAVFFRGDPSNALYLVKNGKVSINVDIKGRFEQLRMVQPGEAFGSNSLIDHSFRFYNAVVASESAELYVIPKVNIFEIFHEHEKIKAKMMTSMAEIYNQLASNLFKSYKASLGFFSLSQVYVTSAEIDDDQLLF